MLVGSQIGGVLGQSLGQSLGNKYLGSEGGKIGGDLGKIVGTAGGMAFPYFSKGGIVKQTGPAVIHKGELVVPRKFVKDVPKSVKTAIKKNGGRNMGSVKTKKPKKK